MANLPGRLVMAQHLRSDHEATEIMLRAVGPRPAVVTEYRIYLDGKLAETVAPKWETVGGIPSMAHAAYARMDEIAGYKLADDRGPDLEASMGR